MTQGTLQPGCCYYLPALGLIESMFFHQYPVLYCTSYQDFVHILIRSNGISSICTILKYLMCNLMFFGLHRIYNFWNFFIINVTLSNIRYFVLKFAGGVFILTCIVNPKVSAIQGMLLQTMLDLACFVTTNFFWMMILTILSLAFPKFCKVANHFTFHF